MDSQNCHRESTFDFVCWITGSERSPRTLGGHLARSLCLSRSHSIWILLSGSHSTSWQTHQFLLFCVPLIPWFPLYPSWWQSVAVSLSWHSPTYNDSGIVCRAISLNLKWKWITHTIYYNLLLIIFYRERYKVLFMFMYLQLWLPYQTSIFVWNFQ